MKLLRTIRLDPSDTFVFEAAAEPGEWAISGAFVFAGVEPASLEGKALAAFRSGFLGLSSLGWSTLAQVVEAEAADRLAAIELAARALLERFGAPDRASARAAAEKEVDFAASLSDHPPATLIAVHRMLEDGSVREAFRTLRPRAGARGWSAFSFAAGESGDDAAERIDLKRLLSGKGA